MNASRKKRDKEKVSNVALAKEIYEKYSEHPLQGDELYRRAYFNAHYWNYPDVEVRKRGGRVSGVYHSMRGTRRERLNYIRPNSYLSVNKLFAPLPQVIAIPIPADGGDNEDRNVARFATDVAEYVHYNARVGLIRSARGAMNYAVRHGTGWLYIYWDPNIKGWTGRKKKKSLYEGDYDMRILSDDSVFPGPATAKEYRHLRWVIVAEMVEVDAVRESYPDKADSIRGYPMGKEFPGNLLSPNHMMSQATGEEERKQCLVLRYYEKPSRSRPNGRFAVVVNADLLCRDGENPYAEFGEGYHLPVVPFFWNRDPDRFHGHSGIEDAIPCQKNVNDIANLIMLSIKDSALLERYFPEGSKINPIKGFVNKFLYNSATGGAPVGLGGTPLPDYVTQYLYSNMSFMSDFMFIKDVTMGQMPKRGSQTSARALQMLMDAAEVQVAHVSGDLEWSLTTATWLVLKLMQKYYTEQRLVTFTGREGKSRVLSFLGTKSIDGFDIQLRVASGIDRQPAAKADLWLTMWREGVLTQLESVDPSEREAAEKFLKTLEFGSDSSITGVTSLQEQAAYRMLSEIKKGKFGPESKEGRAAIVQDIIPGVHDPKIFNRVFVREALSVDFDDLSDEVRAPIVAAIQTFQGMMAQSSEQPPSGAAPPAAPPGPQDMATGFPGYPPPESAPAPQPVSF
jgi:hypothetical protein